MYLGTFSLNDTVYFRVTTVNKRGSALDATVGPTFTVYSEADDTGLVTGTMDKVGTKTGHYDGSFPVSDVTFLIGQHFILIEATVDGQTPAATIAFQLVSDDLSLEETFQGVETIEGSIPLIGQGSESVDHNFGGTDNFRVTSGGTPLADVDIRAFVKTDYDAGRKANQYIVGQSKTKTDGRWVSVMRLDPTTYTLEFSKKGAYRTQIANITVTASVQVMSMGMGMDMGVQAMGISMEEDYSPAPESKKYSAMSVKPVDHNYGGTDNFRIMYGGKPISGVEVKAYKKQEYKAHRGNEEYIVQRTTTKGDGRWKKPLQLSPGAYILEFSKPGVFHVNTTTIKV